MSSVEDVTVKIRGIELEGWTSIQVERSIDTYSTVTLVAPFDPGLADHRSLFRLFKFDDITVKVGRDLLFTGVIVNVSPHGSFDRSEVTVEAYSLPAAVIDCNEPHSALPIKFDDLKLDTIMSILLEPFDVELAFEGDPGAAFEEFKLKVRDKPHDQIAELARQRGFVLSDTAEGRLLCWQSVGTGDPVDDLEHGVPPVAVVSPSYDGRQCRSEVSGYAPAKRGRLGASYTAQNPFLDRDRPHAFVVEKSEKEDLERATLAELGRMFGAIASLSLPDMPTWRDSNGFLWSPNTTVMLTAPQVMIYRKSEFLIRTVSFFQDDKSSTASLELVLPGSFSSEIPQEPLPWDA